MRVPGGELHVDMNVVQCQLLVGLPALCTEIHLVHVLYRMRAQKTCLKVEWKRASLIRSGSPIHFSNFKSVRLGR